MLRDDRMKVRWGRSRAVTLDALSHEQLVAATEAFKAEVTRRQHELNRTVRPAINRLADEVDPQTPSAIAAQPDADEVAERAASALMRRRA